MIKLLFSTVVLCITASVFAQGDIKITHVSDPTTDISGTTVEVVGDPTDPTIYYDMRVINVDGQSISLKFKRVRTSNTGRLDQICDENLCYNADDQYEYTSPALITVAHEDTTLFKPQIVPNNMESCGFHDYYVVNSFGVVYDSIRIKFRTTNSNCFLDLESQELTNNEFNIFPNPTENNLKVEKLTASDQAIIIFDALGKEVLSSKVTTGTEQLKLSALKSGIYFVRVLNANGMLSDPKKLIVRK